MGEVTAIGDTGELAEAIIRIIQHPDEYFAATQPHQGRVQPGWTVSGYQALFGDLVAKQVQSENQVEAREA